VTGEVGGSITLLLSAVASALLNPSSSAACNKIEKMGFIETSIILLN